MDKTDEIILSILKKDARTTFQAISDVVGLSRAAISVAPHEKWTAVYSFVDKCRLVCGQDSGVNRTGLLQ